MSTNNTTDLPDLSWNVMPANLPYWIPAYYVGGSLSEYNAAMNPAIKNIGIFFPQSHAELPPLLKYSTPNPIGFDAQAQATVWAGLRTYEGIIDVKFTPVNVSDAPGTINFVKTTLRSGAVGEGYETRSTGAGAVLISPTYAAPGSPGEGWLLAHETMHALGLKHPTEGTIKIQPQDNGPLWTNVSNTTTDTRPLPPGFSDSRSFAPQPLDIAALQYLYGPSKSVRTGDDTYVLVENNPNFVWDGVGTDTIDGRQLTRGLTLDLNPGTWGFVGAKADHITAPGQVTVNYGSVIENVNGSHFADTITGNAANNVFKGFGGNDRFVLATGNDGVDGGTGIDTVVLSGARASYVATAPNGTVRLASTTDGTKTLSGVERVHFNGGTDGIAYDIQNGIAGDTIKLLGAAGGLAMIANKEVAGIGIHFRDIGMTRDQVSEAAINAMVGPAGTNAAVVNLLWTNLMGSAPSAAEAQPFVDLLNQGTYTRGAMTSAVADLLDQKVGLTGVASYDFTVFGG